MPGRLVSRYSLTMTPRSTANPACSASPVRGRTPMPTTTKSASSRSPLCNTTPFTLKGICTGIKGTPAFFQAQDCAIDDFTLMVEAKQLEERHDELTDSAEGLAAYAEKDRAIAGCIVTIGDDGEFRRS